MPRQHAKEKKKKLGHQERRNGHRNPAVAMETLLLTQLIPFHLSKYSTIRKQRARLYAAMDNKILPKQGIILSLAINPSDIFGVEGKKK